MEIRCRKGDCTHNTGCSCMAKEIMVTRQGNCMTYQKDELKESLIIENGNLFEISSELVAKNLRNVPLKCRASNCLYNRSKECHANGIFIIDDENLAECATFIER